MSISKPSHGTCVQVVTATVDRLSEKLGLSIFSFSVFHVFFEQYLSIARDSLHILGAHPRLQEALLLHHSHRVQHPVSQPGCTAPRS